MSAVQLYNAQDQLIEKATTPDFDPDFLKSFTELWNSTSSADKVARNPYELYSWVYACVTVLTRNIKNLSPILWEKNDPEKIITDHPVLDLLNNPNPMMNQDDFFEAIILYLSLPSQRTPGGQCFVLPTTLDGEPVDLLRGEEPDFLWVASDNFIEPIIDGNRFKGWRYLPYDGATPIDFLPSEIIRIRNFNKNSMLLGLSPYASLASSVITDIKSRELSDKFYTNNASLGNVLTSKGKITQPQSDDVGAKMREKYSGPQNAGKLLTLHSGMTLEQMETKNLSELQFSESKEFTLTEIIACYGVNKMELGMIDDVNRSTAEVMKELLWVNTLIPLMDKIWNSGLNPCWIQYVDKRNLWGGFDLTKVPALRRNTEGKIKAARFLIADGVPPSLAYKTVNLKIDTSEAPWLDEPLVKGARTNLRTGETIGQNKAPEVTAEPEKQVVVKAMDREKRDKIWWDWVKATLLKPEEKYKRMIRKYWVGQRNRSLDRVDSWALSNKKAIINKAVLSDFMPSAKERKAEDLLLVTDSVPIYVDGIKLQSVQMGTELGELVNWDPTAAAQKAIIKSRLPFLKLVNSTTFQTMGKEVSLILEQNPDATVRELTKLIKNAEATTFNARIASSAQTVARTETASIATKTRDSIMKAEKVKKHEWLTAKDEKVRTKHALDDGQTVKIGERFPNTQLLYPLEAGGAPDNIINCRCVTIPKK